VSDRVRELAERQASLQRRCAQQRATCAREVAAIEQSFRSTDRMAGLVRTVLRPPVLIAAAATLLVAGRIRGLRVLGRVLLFAVTARRLLRAARSL
jgi:hypothetical protein